MPDFSIIIPVYNTKQFLCQCLDSVMLAGAMIGNFEMIAVDDGSTDGSGNALDLYAANNRQLKVLHRPHHGVGAARNAGVRIATGKYIVFVDSDDIVADNFMSHLKYLFEATGAELVHYHFTQFVSERKSIGQTIGEYRVLECTRDKMIWAIHALFDVGYSCLCAVRRERICVEWPEDMKMYEDVVWALRAVSLANIVCDSDYAGYGYRKRAHSATSHRASFADVMRYVVRTSSDLMKTHNVRLKGCLFVCKAYLRRIKHWISCPLFFQ